MDLSKLFIVLGVVLLVLGVVFKFQAFNLGKLPGDILIKKGNFTFYFPVTTLIILSVLISLVVAIFRRFL